MKAITSTRIVLDTEYGMAKSLNEYAQNKDLNVVICHAKHPNNYEEYVILNSDNIPIFVNQVAEDIAVHLDIMALGRDTQ